MSSARLPASVTGKSEFSRISRAWSDERTNPADEADRRRENASTFGADPRVPRRPRRIGIAFANLAGGHRGKVRIAGGLCVSTGTTF